MATILPTTQKTLLTTLEGQSSCTTNKLYGLRLYCTLLRCLFIHWYESPLSEQKRIHTQPVDRGDLILLHSTPASRYLTRLNWEINIEITSVSWAKEKKWNVTACRIEQPDGWWWSLFEKANEIRTTEERRDARQSVLASSDFLCLVRSICKYFMSKSKWKESPIARNCCPISRISISKVSRRPHLPFHTAKS